MKIIVGLGNPGEKYKNTRHNTGFMVVDALALKVNSDQWSVNRKFKCILCSVNGTLLLTKPLTFMNDSGIAVFKLSTFYHLQSNDIYVIHDDLDIRLGEYKIQKGIGPKVHYGVQSIEGKLGTKDFWRVRIGVDNRSNDKVQRTKGEQYVLQNFTDDEKQILDKVIENVISDLDNRLNLTI